MYGVLTRAVARGALVLGIAIGIASIVAVVGVTQSSEASLLAQIDQLGTNLLTVVNGQTLSGQEAELPATAPAHDRPHPRGGNVAPTAELGEPGRLPHRQGTGHPDQRPRRPRRPTSRCWLRYGARVIRGSFLNPATARYPAVVLGYQAAITLGIAEPGQASRVWIGGRWFYVVGVLGPVPLAPEIDRSALIGFPQAPDARVRRAPQPHLPSRRHRPR